VMFGSDLPRSVDFLAGRPGRVRPRWTKQLRNTERQAEQGDAEHRTQGAWRRGVEFELPPKFMRIFDIAECKEKNPHHVGENSADGDKPPQRERFGK
jgi:hypothetical protein